ncbi:hypothetical protein CJ430_30160, partial [Klebsiella pneumoniae]
IPRRGDPGTGSAISSPSRSATADSGSSPHSQSAAPPQALENTRLTMLRQQPQAASEAPSAAE